MKNVEMVLVEKNDIATLRRIAHWLLSDGDHRGNRQEAVRVLKEIADKAIAFPVKEGVLPWATYADLLEKAATEFAEKFDEGVPAEIGMTVSAVLRICAKHAREVTPKVQMFQEAAEKAGLKEM